MGELKIKGCHKWLSTKIDDKNYVNSFICEKCEVKIHSHIVNAKILSIDGYVYFCDRNSSYEIIIDGEKLSTYCRDVIINRIMTE